MTILVSLAVVLRDLSRVRWKVDVTALLAELCEVKSVNWKYTECSFLHGFMLLL